MSYKASILADSISPIGVRLVSLEVTYPRFVHAELMTHRVFSRNSASSRAIPISKTLEKVKTNPAMPIWWGKNQSGMQANEELSDDKKEEACKEWLKARDAAVTHVELLMKIGLHKQITNRILEPWMWNTIICTATEWDNFFALRCHSDAQPEIRHISDMMRETMASSTPRALEYGEWHLPLVTLEEAKEYAEQGHDVKMISAGRCARVSYLTHDGRRDPLADIQLAERLVASGHMSPLEHVATPLTRDNAIEMVCRQLESISGLPEVNMDAMFSGNFKGWQQFRKLIPNENNYALVNNA